MLGSLEEANNAYEHALRINPTSVPAMNAISSILRTQEQFPKAVEYLQAIIKIDANNGDVWGSLGRFFAPYKHQRQLMIYQGHCFLMMDDLQQAYSAYQQALYHLRDPKVSISKAISKKCILTELGTEALVWHWDSL